MFKYQDMNSSITTENILGGGGGVAYYIKEHVEFKERKDIYYLDKTIEHQWIEVKGKNKNSSFLVGCLHQPSSIESEKQSWCEKFDNLLSQI